MKLPVSFPLSSSYFVNIIHNYYSNGLNRTVFFLNSLRISIIGFITLMTALFVKLCKYNLQDEQDLINPSTHCNILAESRLQKIYTKHKCFLRLFPIVDFTMYIPTSTHKDCKVLKSTGPHYISLIFQICTLLFP